MDTQQLIELLNEDLSHEYSAIVQYLTYSAKVGGPYRRELSAVFAEELPDETAHATVLANKIVALGGEPTTVAKPVPEAGDAKAMLEAVRDHSPYAPPALGLEAGASFAERRDPPPLRIRWSPLRISGRPVDPPVHAALERTAVIVWMTLAMALLNALLNWILIFGNWGAPALGLQGAAWATLVANSAGFLGMALMAKLDPVAQPFEILTRLWKPDWPAFARVFGLGFPIALTILAEAGLFGFTSIMMGWRGTVELAAHGIALQLVSFSFMVPLGLSQAASVRVASEAGKGDPAGVHLASNAIYITSVGFAVVAAVIFLLMPEPLIRLFLDESKDNVRSVIAVAVSLLFMGALFQIFDTLQVASAGNLRGLQDTKWPMVIAAVAYWPVGVGTAYLFGFTLGWGGVGVWSGLVVGLACAAAVLTWRFGQRERFGLLSKA